ncbi:MAG: hypothetical protein JO254_01050 [Pseudolabrys sp.]|nr:hypothetical protein [Pseudolabrys sp.]
MKSVRIALCCVVVCWGVLPASAQNAPAGLAPPKPYKPVTLTLPQPVKDNSFEALRSRLSDIAKKKDRGALAKLVAEKNFFWDRGETDAADKKKNGLDNLSTALGLNNVEGPGWDMLAGYAEDPTASPSQQHKGALCAPADPAFDAKALNALLDATQTDLQEWGYPVQNGIEVRTTPLATGAAIDKLGLHFVRILPDTSPAAAVASYIRIVTPSGKTGYIPSDTVAPLGNDQLCYVKEAGGAWKIGGYVGAGDAQ